MVDPDQDDPNAHVEKFATYLSLKNGLKPSMQGITLERNDSQRASIQALALSE